MKAMKFLVDENIGYPVINFLRDKGHNVVSVLEEKSLRGADDTVILKSAKVAGRVIITQDKDFGELVFNQSKVHAGVILIRTRNDLYGTQIGVLEKFLSLHTKRKIKRSFWVLSESGMRMAVW